MHTYCEHISGVRIFKIKIETLAQYRRNLRVNNSHIKIYILGGLTFSIFIRCKEFIVIHIVNN